MLFYTYAIFSETTNCIYVGQTNCLSRRFKEPNGINQFNSWTKRHSRWMLIHFEIFISRKNSMAREKQLKSGQGRAFLRSLLSTTG